MRKLLSTISNAIISTINAVVGITTSIENVVEATNSATNSLNLVSKGMEADVQFDYDKANKARAKELALFEAECAALTEEA